MLGSLAISGQDVVYSINLSLAEAARVPAQVRIACGNQAHKRWMLGMH